MNALALSFLAALGATLTVAYTPPPAPRDIRPAATMERVANDPDDPAVWVNRRDPSRSLIIGTNKVGAAEGGALYVWDLNGKTLQVIKGIDRPNNVDVEYGLRLKKGQRLDIVVVTERLKSRLRTFAVRADGSGLKEIGNGIPVFTGETPEDHAAPMGVALYKRPHDRKIFAIVGRKSGPSTGYLWQYRLQDNGNGGIEGVKVRTFGNYSGKKEIESIAVDDALGYVYYSDEQFGVHKWHADPDRKGADKELALFATKFKGDHEGIGIYTRTDGTGYIVCTDQIKGNSEYHLYRREGELGRPHDHQREVGVVRGGADETDGLEVVSAPLGPQFPRGLMAAMNSGPKNFLVFDWRKVEPRRW